VMTNPKLDGLIARVAAATGPDREMTYCEMVQLVEGIGMDVEDGLAATVSGGQLTGGEEAPPWIMKMNCWPVEDVVREILKRKS
jgi:hypothetical protein